MSKKNAHAELPLARSAAASMPLRLWLTEPTLAQVLSSNNVVFANTPAVGLPSKSSVAVGAVVSIPLTVMVMGSLAAFLPPNALPLSSKDIV